MNDSLTLKKIYSLFEGISNIHPMLNDFRFGDPFEDNSRADFKYPMLYLELPVVISNSGFPNFISSWEINYQILDKPLKPDNSTTAPTTTNPPSTATPIELANSLSTTEQIGSSILEYLYGLINCNTQILPDTSAATIYDQNNAIETGWRYSITLVSPHSSNKCNDLLLLGNVCDFVTKC